MAVLEGAAGLGCFFSTSYPPPPPRPPAVCHAAASTCRQLCCFWPNSYSVCATAGPADDERHSSKKQKTEQAGGEEEGEDDEEEEEPSGAPLHRLQLNTTPSFHAMPEQSLVACSVPPFMPACATLLYMWHTKTSVRAAIGAQTFWLKVTGACKGINVVCHRRVLIQSSAGSRQQK